MAAHSERNNNMKQNEEEIQEMTSRKFSVTADEFNKWLEEHPEATNIRRKPMADFPTHTIYYIDGVPVADTERGYYSNETFYRIGDIQSDDTRDLHGEF